MTQTIEYIVKVDANQAKASIADVEKRMEAVGSPTSKFSLGLADITKQSKDMAGRLAPAAAAISSISASMGAAGGAAGKMVAGVGQVVAAFGSGGPLGAAIVAATSAVDTFVSHLNEVEKARESAFEAGFEKQNGNLLTIYKRTQDVNEQLRNLAKELKNVGKTSDQIEEEELKAKISAKRVESRMFANRATDLTFFTPEERKEAERKSKALEVEANNIDKLLIERIKLRQLIQVEANEKAAKAENEAAEKRRQDQMKNFEEEFRLRILRNKKIQELDEVETSTDEISRTMRGMRGVEGGGIGEVMRGKQEEQQKKAEERKIEAAKMTAEFMRSLREQEIEDLQRSLDMQRQAWKDFGSGFVQLGVGMFGPVAGASQQFFDDLITGQEHAAEMMGISLMRTAGDALVGHGVNLLGQSVVSALTPGLQPLAVAQAGSGLGLVAAGIGLGAGATAGAHVLAGGQIGKKLPEKDNKDPGASPRRGRDSGGSGGLNVYVTYGAGGPLPEDIAREIDKVVKQNDRRRGAA
jgi:hypothetical protein